MTAAAVSGAICAVCGESVAGADVCFSCLLRGGLEGLDTAGEADARFGDFEIVRRDDGSLCELGRGSMGVTYRARDTVLHREVALKVIEPAAVPSDWETIRERFLREARSAAALRHPNIAAVHQFGATPDRDRCYCAMELVDGETLEARVRRVGPITPDLAVDAGMQVARALIAAAERGLVHRDLKPGNIMLGRCDSEVLQVKVIDFGLAKAVSSMEQMELTRGGFVGTPAFASPEQFKGDPVDGRADIYALGVTLWFALTGRLPSAGTTMEEIRQRQAQHKLPVEQLQLRGVPRPLITLLRTCLEIDPANRPASPRELLRALEECRAQIGRRNRRRTAALVGLAAAMVVAVALALRPSPAVPPSAGLPVPRPIEKGIAVLPFNNLSANGEDAFLAEGIQDDVLTTVGKIKDLKVIARSSVQGYGGSRGPGKARELGESLRISHILDGSVRRAADRIIVNVALIDTRDERQVWAERYDRSLSEAASLHGEVAREIGRALQATLTPAEYAAATGKPTENAEAYLLYLKGREMEIQRDDTKKVVELYKQAVTLDPKFALARARLSKALTALFYQQNRADVQAHARDEAEEALRLQPNLGEARVALAHWHLYLNRDLDRASEELHRAVELLPNSAEVQLTAAFLYKRQQRFGDRIAALHRAETLDPRNPSAVGLLILTSRWVRDWKEAMQASDRRAVFTTGPAYLVSRWMRANDEFRLTGDISSLKRALAQDEHAETPLPPVQLNYQRFEIASLERDFGRAAHFLDQIPAEAFVDSVESQSPLSMMSAHDKDFHQTLLAVASGRGSVAAGEALARMRMSIEAALKAGPRVEVRGKLHADLALVQAFAGRKNEAIQNAERAIELHPLPWSAIERNDVIAVLALVHAQAGEADKALDLIEHLLTVPVELQDGAVYNMTLTDLKWRWVWDPLREHPRFQKLVAGAEPKTAY